LSFFFAYSAISTSHDIFNNYCFSLVNLHLLSQTVGHFLLSSAFTGYIVFAVIIYEEPLLVEKLGPEYVQYMKRTPRFIPNLPGLGQKTSRDWLVQYLMYNVFSAKKSDVMIY